MNSIRGHYIDIYNRRTYSAEVTIHDGCIHSINAITESVPQQYILPGFIDAHIHIESSMLVPYEFARIALKHGTVTTVSDPHEIANVMGVQGIQYMIDNARDALLKFHFGAPSCVPATSFETAGANIDPPQIKELLASEDIFYLAEMMNYPGVLNQDPDVIKKIEYARLANKPIDGHAPGLRGTQAREYVSAGITTDHECYTLDEALDKLKFGMKIIIREGSAAKNFNALHPLIASHTDRIMFCSDDKHPDDLIEGHINELVVRSLQLGYDLYDILQIACINPIGHYNLTTGSLRVGDPADFITVRDTENFEVISTYINGRCVMHNHQTELPQKVHPIMNQFNIKKTTRDDFIIKNNTSQVPVIQAIDGALITEKFNWIHGQKAETLHSNSRQDILKIAVINRYRPAPVALGFIKGFGIQSGAIASTVAHDSHNIIAVGVDDADISAAVNLLVKSKGGLSAVRNNHSITIALPIAGLMSDQSGQEIGQQYATIDQYAKDMGCTLTAPYMTLSFMALLVIPKIKISDLGMFDAETFTFYTSTQ